MRALNDPCRGSRESAEDPDAGDMFDACELYGFEEDERTHHETPEDAVLYWAIGWIGIDVDSEARAVIADMAPCRVIGFRREAVTDEWIARQAACTLYGLAEQWDDDFEDPDDFENTTFDEWLPQMIALVRQMVTPLQAWRCKPIAMREYDADAVLAIVKRHRPEWLKEIQGES